MSVECRPRVQEIDLIRTRHNNKFGQYSAGLCRVTVYTRPPSLLLPWSLSTTTTTTTVTPTTSKTTPLSYITITTPVSFTITTSTHYHYFSSLTHPSTIPNLYQEYQPCFTLLPLPLSSLQTDLTHPCLSHTHPYGSASPNHPSTHHLHTVGSSYTHLHSLTHTHTCLTHSYTPASPKLLFHACLILS